MDGITVKAALELVARQAPGAFTRWRLLPSGAAFIEVSDGKTSGSASSADIDWALDMAVNNYNGAGVHSEG